MSGRRQGTWSSIGTTKRRSRNRLPRSQVVSETNKQAWQAAPCKKPAGACGSRSAQCGSEEYRRVVQGPSHDLRQRLVPGERDEPAEGALGVGTAV